MVKRKNNLTEGIINLTEELLLIVGLGLFMAGLILINSNPLSLVIIGVIMSIVSMVFRARRLTK